MNPGLPLVFMSAKISRCGRYRYLLLREWERTLPKLAFVMLNPSTADASTDDPTIRRCIGFARREGCGGVVVANVFAFRATSPRDLAAAPAPVGPRNREALREIARTAQRPIVCAWGAQAGPAADDATAILREAGASLACLGRTQAGHPRHPLYVRRDAPIVPFS